jgi:endonuclease/exonuclease/phosphatase (EEP) superfamily protein YafD
MRILLTFVRLLIGLLALGAALPAVGGAFGFAVPVLDLFNHLTLLAFFGSLSGLVLVLLTFGKSRWKPWVAGIAALGLVASSALFVPEWLAATAPHPALPADGRPVLKLMTNNSFGLNRDMQHLAGTILKEDPDIVALQEYFPEQAAELPRLLRSRYPYYVRCQGGKRANLGLFSKLAFDKEMGKGDCPANARGTQRTAHILAGFTLADGTRFSVLTTHLDWPYPIERQQTELGDLAKDIRQVEGPLLVVGDFNSTSWSYALKGFAADAGLTRETHGLPTYPAILAAPRQISVDGFVAALPFLPLDQVFTRGGIVVHDLHRGPSTGSDHLPVVVSFSVGP